MTPEEYTRQAATLGQAAVSNVFMGLRAGQEQLNASRDFSLRERSYVEQTRQSDRNYEMESKRMELTGKYQDAQMQAWNRQAVDWEADTTTAPIVAEFTSQLENLHGDPDAIEKWSPDMSAADQVPEAVRSRVKAKLAMAGRELKDKAFASSTEYKDRSERGALLLKGSKFLTPDNGFTEEARGVSEMLGRKLLRRQPLTQEEEMMAASLTSKVEREVQKRDPDLMKARYKYGIELTIEGLRTATVKFNEASKSYREAVSNPVIPKSIKEELKAERDQTALELEIAQKNAGVPNKLSTMGDEEEAEQKAEQKPKQEKKKSLEDVFPLLPSQKKAAGKPNNQGR